MLQLVFVKKNNLEWREVDPPKRQSPGDALVKPLAIARCDLDLPIVKGETLMRPPFPMGHEFVAEIIEPPDNSVNFKKGQRVIVPFQISCGACPMCAAKLTNSCESVDLADAYGLGPPARKYGGAIAERVLVPFAEAMLMDLPDGIDPLSVASISDNMTDGYRTVGPTLAEKPGGEVLVIGGMAVSVGLYAACMAKILGASKVDYMSSNRAHLEMAETIGVNAVEMEVPKEYGRYDITVDTSNSFEGLNCALRSLKPFGICTSASIFFKNKVPIPFLNMYNYGVTFKTGRTNARIDTPAVLDLIQNKGFKPEILNTAVANFDEAPEAMMEEGIKLVIRGPG